MESKIISYLKSEFAPDAILLGGSRAKGRATEKSDWDLFLVGAKKNTTGFVDFEGQRLDVTFKDWPQEGKPLTIPTGPLWPLNVLVDDSHGQLEKVLIATKDYLNEGPLAQHKGKIADRLGKLDSWKRKIEKYANSPMVEFVYAGIFYEVAIRVWFEVHNMWSLAPVEALPIIEQKDKDFYDSLSAFIFSTAEERPRYTETLLSMLNDTWSNKIN